MKSRRRRSPREIPHFRTTAVLALMLIGVAGGQEDGIKEIAVHHQICCSPQGFRSENVDLHDKQSVAINWSKMLTRLYETPLVADTDRCLHVSGVSNVITQAEDAEYNGPLPPRGHQGDEWTFEHRVANFRPEPEEKKAQCAGIAFFVPEASEPLKPLVDFFTPEFLEELSRRRPKIRIEQGLGAFAMDGGVLKLSKYHPLQSKFYHDNGQAKGGLSSADFATEEELQSVLTRNACRKVRKEDMDRHQCKRMFNFLGAFTNTKVPAEYEVMGLVPKEEYERFLTIEKFKKIDFTKAVAALEREVERPKGEKEKNARDKRIRDSVNWRAVVPLAAMERMRLRVMKGGPRKSSKSSRELNIRDSSPQLDVYNLEFMNDRLFYILLEKSTQFVAEAKESPPTDRNRMRSAFASTEIAERFRPTPRSSGKGKSKILKLQKSKGKSRKGSLGETAYRITNFLLVNSLLAVSNTKYSDILVAGAIHRLQRMRMPIFSVCADKITWEPQLPPTGSSSGDWLASNYRFIITGSRHFSIEYRNLDEVNAQEELSDSSQCAILALVGVAEEGFRDLTRQPFDVIFGIFTPAQMGKDWSSNYELIHQDDNYKLPSISVASQVDAWKLVPTAESSGLTLGQLLTEVANQIQQTGAPEWPQDEEEEFLKNRSSGSGSGGRSRRRSEKTRKA